MNLHAFIYGASRRGKTTAALHFQQADLKLLIVTREPGPAQAAIAAQGREATDAVRLISPSTPEELDVLLSHTSAYLARHCGAFAPQVVLFDNLRGMQQLIIGEPEAKATKVADVDLPAKPATGIMKLPNARDIGAPGIPAFKDYRILDRLTRRFVTAVDNLPFHTIITAQEDIGYDARTRLDTMGMDAKQAAGRPRKIRGMPSLEGFEVKDDLPGLISGPYIHLTSSDGRFIMHFQPHEAEGITWFADPRGSAVREAQIDWTNKSAYDILVKGGKAA